MGDEKENSTSSVKSTHKMCVSVSKYFRAIHIFVFFFILLCLSFVALSYANLFRVQTNVDSARYLLSALVQSQAAILAIVISLTLIAVQLSASAYSPRVIKIFRESLGWQALFVLYGISIFYGLLVLKMIKGATNSSIDLSPITYLDISLKGHISLAYIFGIVTFMVLILYMRGIIGFLNPINLLNLLAKEISKDKILEYLKSVENDEEVKNGTFEDPIQPIMDIVHGSIMKYDIATTRVGLKAVTDRVIDIIGSKSETEISKHFCGQLMRVANLAAEKRDEEAILAVIRDLATFMNFCAEKKLEQVSMYAVQSIGEIGMTASEKDLEYATIGVLLHLKEAGKTALDGSLKGTENAAFYLGEIGITFAKKESAHVSGEWVYSARVINVITDVVKSLLTIGIIALEKQCKLTILEATKGLAKNALLSEELVKTAIQNYESELTEEDCEYFQRFMELYEEELERQQAARETLG